MKLTSVFLILFAFITVLLNPFSISAQQPKNYTTPIKVDPASKARIEFLEKFWDFGIVPRGHIVYHNFAFRNIGTDTLVITKVKPTCGCTAAPLSNDHVAPGDTAKISVTLDTSKLRGKVRKFVNIDCNDPINPYYKISFKAEIDSLYKAITVEPLVADFGDIHNGQKTQIVLEITNGSGSALNLSIADKPGDDIMTATFADSQLKTGASTTMTLEIMTFVEPGPFATTIALEAEGMPELRISVPVIGNVIE